MRCLALVIWLFILVAGARATDSSLELARDPFAPPQALIGDGAGPMPARRYPLAEMRLVATACGAGFARALIEDPDGLGFVVVTGDMVGVEGGRVSDIRPGRVVIEKAGFQPVVLQMDPEEKSALETRSDR